MHKAFKACTAVLLALVMTVSLVNGALAAVVRNDDDTISYEPLEQGVYSKGGYTIDKVSHPTLGAGEVDGILTGDLQDRGQSYSWSMAEAGDYVYIGTCYNSTYYIYHNNVKTSLDAMKKEGKLDQNVDTSRAAADFVKVMFGTDTFDETPHVPVDPRDHGCEPLHRRGPGDLPGAGHPEGLPRHLPRLSPLSQGRELSGRLSHGL